ncbi:MAG: MaoC family dehydratase [Alphaproteobacteria bacterium]|nr:MaoC family dehydratase [Alphaproteobacteria bacterium]
MTNVKHFEDFAVGDVIQGQSATVTEAQILDFAWAWDPQPFHTSIPAAEASHFNGLVASGFQTLALTFRLVWQASPWQATNIGGHGIDAIRWPRPVRPGDTLTAQAEVLELTPSRSKPFGTARIRYSAVNQDGAEVMTAEMLQIITKRPSD